MQVDNPATTKILTRALLAVSMASLVFTLEASERAGWVYSARFTVEDVNAYDDDRTQITLIPAEPGDRPLSCEKFIVHARFQPPPEPNRYHFSQERHDESIRLLEAAVRNAFVVYFGSRGIGRSHEARSCEIDILGLNYSLETADDVFADFMIWPSWQ